MVSLVDRIASSLIGTALAVVCLSVAAILGGIAFRLTLAGSIAIYFVVWWTLLFAILPIGIRSQEQSGTVLAGSDPSAPADPALRQRAIWTTIVSAVVFVAVAAFFPLAGV